MYISSHRDRAKWIKNYLSSFEVVPWIMRDGTYRVCWAIMRNYQFKVGNAVFAKKIPTLIPGNSVYKQGHNVFTPFWFRTNLNEQLDELYRQNNADYEYSEQQATKEWAKTYEDFKDVMDYAKTNRRTI